MFAHGTTAFLSWHVQNFVVIPQPAKRNFYFKLRWKRRRWNGTQTPIFKYSRRFRATFFKSARDVLPFYVIHPPSPDVTHHILHIRVLCDVLEFVEEILTPRGPRVAPAHCSGWWGDQAASLRRILGGAGFVAGGRAPIVVHASLAYGLG